MVLQAQHKTRTVMHMHTRRWWAPVSRWWRVGMLFWVWVGIWSCSSQRNAVIPPTVPDNPLAKMAQASEYLNRGQCDRAVALYYEVIPEVEKQPGIAPYQVAELYTYLGMGYLCLRQYDMAIQQFQKALALEPLYHPARNGLGVAYTEKGMYQEAERVFIELLKVPDFPPAAVYFNLTKLYVREQRWTKALFTARKAVDLAPDELAPRLLFAQILRQLNMVPDAIAQYRIVVKKWPQNLEALEQLASLYEETRDYCEAKRLYFRILEIDPVGDRGDRAAAKVKSLPCDRPIVITPPSTNKSSGHGPQMDA